MKLLTYIVICSVLLAACKEQDITQISSRGKSAESVYVTHDHKNNPVVVWTERDGKNLSLFYAISYDNGRTFSDRKGIPLTENVATHAESMPKVAFKKDGTIIAAFEKKSPTRENKYAGNIYYIASTDAGRTWTNEQFIHSDTVSGRSRSYFDIEQLPDGEVGASWLDIRLHEETGGRSIRFAKTTGSKFTNEILIDSSACQCCRIDVYSDITGRTNIAYRGLMKGSMGKSIRDMMLATSNDDGKTFSRPAKISQDEWAIDGCPHTGASLCSNKSGLYSFWYTEGNGTGLFYSFKENNDASFGERQLISNFGHHPQSSANDTRFVMVWEETVDDADNKYTNIAFQTSDQGAVKKGNLTPKHLNAYLPVVTQITDGFLVAFLMETEEGVGIYTARL